MTTPGTRRYRDRSEDDAWYRLLGLPVLALLAAGIGTYATGAPLSRSILIALTLGTVTWLLAKSLTLSIIGWPTPPDSGAEWGRAPRLWDVPGLDAAVDRPRYMARRALVRLATTTHQLLARSGIGLDSAEARELLGHRAVELLTDPECRPPTADELSRLIGMITALAAAGGGGRRPLPIPEPLLPTERRRSRRRPTPGPKDVT